MGTLGDRIGRRRLLLVGGAAFGVLSVAGAVASDPLTLIVVRALLGVAGATLIPSTLALITNMFRDDRDRGLAIAIWATGNFTGGALGPVLAGVLLQHFWWGSIFLVAVPAMAVLLLAGPLVLPEFRGDGAGRLDPASVVLSLVATVLVVFAVKEVTLVSVALLPAVALVAGVVAGALFVRRQLRLERPLLDLRLFRNRPVTAVIVALVFAGVAMAGTGLLVTQYLQGVLGYSPFASAVLFAPMGLGVAAGTMTAPLLVRRVSPPVAITGGLVVSALGSLLLVGAGLPRVVAGVTVLALGTGPLFALGTGLVLGSVPPDRAGAAAAMSETGNYLGGSLGTALLGVLAGAVYRERMNGTSDSLADALARAAGLPAAEAADLLLPARAAFTDGLRLTGVVAAVIFTGLAVLVASTRSPAGRAVTPPAQPMVTTRAHDGGDGGSS
jgi:DHA2 family multidrug resistance protein-like MFS transporter